MPTNGSHYNRLQQAFLRVFGSTIFFGTKDEHAGAEVWDTNRRHFLDHMRIWFRNQRLTESTRKENIVTLSPAFWDELIAHPIPVDTEVIRALANNPGCLDLYTWLTWRCHQAKDAQRIPLFGPMGLANQLGVQEVCARVQISGTGSAVAGAGATVLAGLPGEDREERSVSRIE